jgi:GT2 family glycosyltransferase
MVELPDPQRLGPAPARTWSGAGPDLRLARLHPDLVLLEVACAVAPPPGAAALLVEARPLAPPTAALMLGDSGGSGGSGMAPRLFFVARDRGGLLPTGAACELRRGEHPVATFVLGPPEAAEPMLLEREAEERQALLRFLVSTCAPLLRVPAPGLAAACHALARGLAAGAAARPLCRPGAAFSLWHVPAAAAGGAWHLLERGGLRRVAAPQDGLLILGGPPPAADALLLPPGAEAQPIRLAAVPAALPPLRDHLASLLAAGTQRPSRILAALAHHAATDAACAALLREAQLLAPARPRRATDPVAPVGGAIELALADGAGGVFLCGWLRDPLRLVAGMELRSGLARRPVPAGALHRLARPDLAEAHAQTAFGADGPTPGFLAQLPGADHPAVAQWRLALRLHSGEVLELTAPPARLRPTAARDLVLRAAHPSALRPGLLEDCIAPAAAALHRAALAAAAGAPDVLRIGAAPPRRPRAAIVVPLYRNLRFLRFQLAAFARDPATRAAELIYVLDSPEQRAEVEHLLRGMAALHEGLAVALVVMPENRGYASACNAGAAVATAPVLAMLNSDVLPAAPGWLEALLRRLARDRRLAAVGPKLLFDDGAIQHAGLLFRRGADGQWLNDHYAKGFPRHYAPACVARRVPGVTGAALILRRPAFEAAGGFCTDYIIGDFEDSDLCLKLRAGGGEIGYEPAAELFHFERQSISEHGGHARTLAGAYNRLLHHRRWDAAIAALMPRFADGI